MASAHYRLESAVEGEFPQKLKEAFGERLDSVVLYGSYVQGSFDPGVSDVNVLVLLTEPDPEAMGRLSRSAGRLMRRHRITPLIMSSHEFARSSDVFPMEYLDIEDRHRVLHGDDPTATLSVDRRNLRHQLEHQMRGNLISLRQLVLGARGRKRLLGRELKRWYGPVAAVFRGLLRLVDADEVPTEPRPLISTVNQVLGLEPGPFLELIAYRNGESKDPEKLAADLLARLADLVRIVDTMES
jgi:predicted nucleotidyltransferase